MTIVSSIKNSSFIQFMSCWLLEFGDTGRAALLVAKGTPMCPIVTSQMLLLQHCDVIENNSIGNNVAIPLVEKFKLLIISMSGSLKLKKNSLPQPPKSVVCTRPCVIKVPMSWRHHLHFSFQQQRMFGVDNNHSRHAFGFYRQGCTSMSKS